MKNIFIVYLLILLSGTSMAQGQLRFTFGRNPEPEVPGYAGRVVGLTRYYKLSDGRYGNDAAALPYARVCLIDGKDTVRLICDAIGAYFWRTNKIPDTLEIHVTAAGFETYMKKYPAKDEGKNWVTLQVWYDKTKLLNDVTISANKIEVAIQGDTTTYSVENAFKTLEGDFVGDLLRELPGFARENGFLTVNGKPIHRVHVNMESFRNTNGKDVVISNIKRMVEQEEATKKQEKSVKKNDRRCE